MRDRTVKGLVYTVCVLYLCWIGFAVSVIGPKFEGRLVNYHQLHESPFYGIKGQDIWLDKNSGDMFFYKSLMFFEPCGYTIKFKFEDCWKPDISLFSINYLFDGIDILEVGKVNCFSEYNYSFYIDNDLLGGEDLILVVRVTPMINDLSYVGVEYSMKKI